MKIVVLDGCAESSGYLSRKGFEKQGEPVVYDRAALEDIVSHIGGAEIVNKTLMTAATFNACQSREQVI